MRHWIKVYENLIFTFCGSCPVFHSSCLCRRRGLISPQRTGQAGGLISATETRKVAEVIVKEIRQMSERGTPIMSPKGLTS